MISKRPLPHQARGLRDLPAWEEMTTRDRKRAILARLRDLRAGILARRDQQLRVAYAPSPPDPHISEAAFQALVIDLMHQHGWWVHHETDSRKTSAGFPDLVATRPPRLLIAELKVKDGAQSEPQRWWGIDLRRCPGVEYRLWRPEDWLDILLTLAAPDARQLFVDGAAIPNEALVEHLRAPQEPAVDTWRVRVRRKR